MNRIYTLTSIGIKIMLLILMINAIGKNPYGYYVFMRIAVSWLCLALFIFEIIRKIYLGAIISILGLILFNPIEKIHLNKELWQSIDKSSAVFLSIWIIIDIVLLFYNKSFFKRVS